MEKVFVLILSGNIIAEKHGGERDYGFFKWNLFAFGKKSPWNPEMGLIDTFDFFLKAASREEHASIHSRAEKGEFIFWL